MEWKTSWSYAQRGTYFTAWDQTSFSYTFRNNLCGTAFRLKYSNWYGKKACNISSVKLTMCGKEYFMFCKENQDFCVYPNHDIYSDEIAERIEPCDVFLTVEFADQKRPESGNTFLPGVVMIVQALEVMCENHTDVVALFGDSITHWGYWSTPLINRVYEQRKGGGIAVFETAINGSRLLNGSPKSQLDGLGYCAQRRFAHDILEAKGVTCCVFALGLNDLSMPEEDGEVHLTLETYSECTEKIILRAHEQNIRMVGLTICPRLFDEVYTKEKNILRQDINQWILNEASFDAVLDIATIVANKDHTMLAPEYDCGDGVHISEAAGQKIAAAFTDEILFL